MREGSGMMRAIRRHAAPRRAAAAAVGAVERADLRLARGAEVPPRARAALRPGHDADHVHAALHLRVRRGAGGVDGDYLQFFLPGILVQTVSFNAVYSGMGLSTDLGKGLFDRFRSLPIWPLAPYRRADRRRRAAPPDRGRDHPGRSACPRLPAGGGGAGGRGVLPLLLAIGFGSAGCSSCWACSSARR